MSNTAIVNIKIDPKTKKRLKKFADEIGLPMSALLNAQIKQMLRAGRVELTCDLAPTSYLQKLIKEAEADYAAGRNITTIEDEGDIDAFFKSLEE